MVPETIHDSSVLARSALRANRHLMGTEAAASAFGTYNYDEHLPASYTKIAGYNSSPKIVTFSHILIS